MRKHLYQIYDNKGKTIDRYTILFEPFHFGKSCDALTLSSNPNSPQGVVSTGDVYQQNLGKKVTFGDLPDEVRDYIADYLNRENDS